jgi:hypothetical protein
MAMNLESPPIERSQNDWGFITHHVLSSDRQERRERQPDQDENAIADREDVNWQPERSELERTICDMLAAQLCNDNEQHRHDVGQIQPDC